MLGDFANLKVKVPSKVGELKEIIDQLESKAEELEIQGEKELESEKPSRHENPEESKKGRHHRQEKHKFDEQEFPDL